MIKQVKSFIKKYNPIIILIEFDTPIYVGFTKYDNKKLRKYNKIHGFKLYNWDYDVKTLRLTLFYE